MGNHSVDATEMVMAMPRKDQPPLPEPKQEPGLCSRCGRWLDDHMWIALAGNLKTALVHPVCPDKATKK